MVGTEATVQSGMYTKVIQGMNPKIEVIEKHVHFLCHWLRKGSKNIL